MAARGDIYKDTYAGWYSVRDEAYYGEAETEVRPDGVRYGPQGTPVDWVEEESYFFRLSAYQDRLLAHYDANPDFIGPDERRNEVVSFVKGGLRDLSISRTTFDWGIKVPERRTPRHVCLGRCADQLHYRRRISRRGLAALALLAGRSPRYRQGHRSLPRGLLAGLSVLRRACRRPSGSIAHGFLFNRGEKMSKSVGNVVDPFALIEHYGLDPVRYFFLREVPFGQDGNYSHEAIVGRINADLANDLGNLAQRSLSMIAKNCEGILPAAGDLTADDKRMIEQADALIEACRAVMAKQQIHQALNAIWSVVADANRYFAGAAPWELRKTDLGRMGSVLYVTAEVVRQVAILVQPIMPAAAARLLDLLAVPMDSRTFGALGEKGRLAAGVTLPAPEAVFPRYVEADGPAAG